MFLDLYFMLLVRIESVLDHEPDSRTHVNKGRVYIKVFLPRNTDL